MFALNFPVSPGAGSEPKEVWNLPEMDFVMVHSYSRHNRTDMADNSQFSTVETAKLFGKPTYVHTPPKLPLCLALCLSVCRSVCQPVSHTWFTGQVAETGEQTTNDNLFPADPHGIGMHNALWASMASMGAMSSAVWWWDNWVAPNNLCTHRSMGAFALPTHHTLIVSRGLFAGAGTAT